MKVAIVFVSLHGNTKKVALGIAESFAKFSPQVLAVSQIDNSELLTFDLIILGSPTHGGKPTESMISLVDSLCKGDLEKKKIAVFDTRMVAKDQNLGLKIVMSLVGYAASKMAKKLVRGGAKLIFQEGFFVKGKTGPLQDGEPQRVKIWSQLILNQIQ